MEGFSSSAALRKQIVRIIQAGISSLEPQNAEITVIKVKTIPNCKISIKKSNKVLSLPFFLNITLFPENWWGRPGAQLLDLLLAFGTEAQGVASRGHPPCGTPGNL